MGRTLRITFVAPFGIRHRSTVWARILPLTRELNHVGHSVRILVPPWDSPQDAGTLLIQSGVILEHIDLGGGLPGITARLLRRIYSEHPDIVHIVKPRAYAGIVQWCLWQTRKCGAGPSRIVLDIDDWERPWAAINRYPRYQARFLQWQEEWGIRHADGISAASRWLANRATAAAPGTPVVYLPNGIDPLDRAVTRDYGSHRPPRVLLLSRFVEVTPAWLGEFWRVLHREMDEAVLIIAGKALHAGGETTYLHALKSALPADQSANVVWLGYIDPVDLPDLYRFVDCAVFPSENSAMLQAKCSVRMATALQYGVPVVASSVGEQAAFGAHGAARLLLPDSTPAEFALAVAGVLSSANCRREIGSAAVERMESAYPWSKLAHRLEQFYLQLMSNE